MPPETNVSPQYTTSSLLLLSLSNAGITHLFVNWGSDHPGLLEDLQRQRSTNIPTSTNPEIITCPNEMVALSCAQGYAQVTGKPAGVIVHVDVGTQALAGAIHNVDRARVPVIIYAGASPVTNHNEGGRGTRNEWILWIQDIPDQPSILRQYMRHTVQIESPGVVGKVVRRALGIAKSAPKGPVYVWARREVMEAEVGEAVYRKEQETGKKAVTSIAEKGGLSPKVLAHTVNLLFTSKNPLILTSSLGTNPNAVPLLSQLASLLAIPVVQVCPITVNIGWDQPYHAGITYCFPGTHSPYLKTADVILILDCLLPWIPANLTNEVGEEKLKGKKVVWIDSGDVLGRTQGNRHLLDDMGLEDEDVLLVNADVEIALSQINKELVEKEPRLAQLAEAEQESGSSGKIVVSISADEILKRRSSRRKEVLVAFEKTRDELKKVERSIYAHDSNSKPVSLSVPFIMSTLKSTTDNWSSPTHINTNKEKPLRVLYLNESISNFPATWNHIRPTKAGEMITSGGSSLGWGLGAAVGASIAGEVLESEKEGNGKPWDLIVLIVGDGSFLFGVPGSAYWMARRYNTPFLTVVLNNSGWKSPRNSMASVHPFGHGTGHLGPPSSFSSRPSGDTLSVGFGPVCPDYVGIARSASGGNAPWVRKLSSSSPYHPIAPDMLDYGVEEEEPWLWGSKISFDAIGEQVEVDGVPVQKTKYYEAAAGKGEDATRGALGGVFRDAVRAVVEEGRCALLDVVIENV